MQTVKLITEGNDFDSSNFLIEEKNGKYYMKWEIGDKRKEWD